ncbi:uncharacterized protein LOC108815327 [Raphanus sativus]|uniref:Uncharacterized protein LOC108815327 n=1 Tax=Raphanus sativus TaxID=3726 RepID=A0A6J0K7C7_RAPSA|nr:uncharacterized protein LOC108815327 [Raphanus sativus]
MVLEKATEAEEEWRSANNREPAPSPVRLSNNSSRQRWCPPQYGALKCNIGVSWDQTTSISGAAWILRDNNGAVLLHSRRAFSGVSSLMEAELCGFWFAVESMVSTRQRNVIFESHYNLAREALLNPTRFPSLCSLLNEIISLFPRLQTWQMAYAGMRMFNVIVLLQGLRTVWLVMGDSLHIYIARGGPSWLLVTLNAEASGS